MRASVASKVRCDSLSRDRASATSAAGSPSRSAIANACEPPGSPIVSRYVGPDGSLPVRALAADSSGMLVACPGGWPLTRFHPTGGYGKSGDFRAGPIAVSVPPMAWHRWRVDADPPHPAAGVQLFSLVAPPGPNPPPPGSTDDPFPASSGWAALPRNQLDVAILDDDARAVLDGEPTPGGSDVGPDDPPRDVWIWIAGRLEGDHD